MKRDEGNHLCCMQKESLFSTKSYIFLSKRKEKFEKGTILGVPLDSTFVGDGVRWTQGPQDITYTDDVVAKE